MRVITIGRSEEGNDVVFSDPLVSRHHFQIVQQDDGSYRLSDLGSSNGTYINGNRVFGEVELGENDIVRVGNTIVPWKQYFSSELDFPTSDLSGGPQVAVQTGAEEPPVQKPEEDSGSSGGRLALLIVGIVIGSGLILFGLGRNYGLAALGAGVLLANIIVLVVLLNDK